MARPLRIEFAGALYYVTARGNARENIYHSDDDRQQFFLSGHYTPTQVGDYFDMSYATVSRAVKQIERDNENVKCKA